MKQNQTVFKWPMPSPLLGEITHQMRRGHKVVHLAVQNDELHMWTVGPQDGPSEPRTFEVYGTGHDVPGDRAYVGTVQSPPFVWHVFEVPNQDSLSDSKVD